MDGITFEAIFQRATTLVDGGWRITLDLSEKEARQVLLLSQLKSSVLQVAVVPQPEEDSIYD